MEIKIVPRFFINGVLYTMDQLPKEQVAKIVEERVDQAMSRINFERQQKGRQAVKRNIIISAHYRHPCYIPAVLAVGRTAGCRSYSIINAAWMLIQGTESEGRRP